MTPLPLSISYCLYISDYTFITCAWWWLLDGLFCTISIIICCVCHTDSRSILNCVCTNCDWDVPERKTTSTSTWTDRYRSNTIKKTDNIFIWFAETKTIPAVDWKSYSISRQASHSGLWTGAQNFPNGAPLDTQETWVESFQIQCHWHIQAMLFLHTCTQYDYKEQKLRSVLSNTDR